MLRRFPPANEDDRNIPAVALFQNRIGINIDFPEGGAELSQERRDGGLGFLAKVASWTRIEGDRGQRKRQGARLRDERSSFGCEVASYREAGVLGKNERIMKKRSMRSK